MYDLVMFDLDGTLVNSEEGVTKTVQYALSACGIEENNQDNLRRFIGPPLIDAFMEYYGMTEAEGLKALEKYREAMDRPEENGKGSPVSGDSRDRVASLSGRGIRDILKRVENGAKIKF